MHFGGEKVGKHSVRFPWVSIGAASGRALYPCQFATLVGIWIRDHQASIQADFCVQPAISMRWIFGMVFFKQSNIRPQAFHPIRRIGHSLFPGVKAASGDIHCLAKPCNRIFSCQFKNHLVFLLSKFGNSLSTPTPFTSYPFFARASRIREFITS